MNDPSRGVRVHWPEVAVLAVACLAFAAVLAPAHWTSIWMDREFTGWVAPISNRMADGQRLYVDGAHSPMAPLPYLLLLLVTWGHATWLTESAAIVIAQSVLLLATYAALSQSVRRPIPFLATFLAIPVVFALPKTIFYDALTQMLAAVSLAVLAAVHRATEAGEARRSRVLAAVLGVVLASCVLSKQSTGAGLILGTGATLLAFPRSVSWRMRIGGLAAVATGGTVGLIAWAAVLAPFVSLPGLVHDVFVIGSEPKGGVTRILANLLDYPHFYASTVFHNLPVIGAVLGAIGLGIAWRRRSGPQGPTVTAYAVAGIAVLGLAPLVAGDSAPAAWMNAQVVRPTLYAGLTLFVMTMAAQALPTRVWPGRANGECQAALGLAAGTAALFHNLSVYNLRWEYDNNPLIPIVLAATLTPLVSGSGRVSAAGMLGAAWIGVGCWLWSVPQLEAALACTERWPEVAFLSGARLNPSADGMRQVVRIVREAAPDAERDEVLLLPEDPNVQAWFDRPRPRLTSAIVFTDQYWDHSVEEDFTRLKSNPPKVIAIGPRDYWRPYSQYWNIGRGAERLIDLVERELLPDRYELRAEQPILLTGNPDAVQIYVRRDAAEI